MGTCAEGSLTPVWLKGSSGAEGGLHQPRGDCILPGPVPNPAVQVRAAGRPVFGGHESGSPAPAWCHCGLWVMRGPVSVPWEERWGRLEKRVLRTRDGP